jgi:5,5'-dehydrodivanillate O-demethylase
MEFDVYRTGPGTLAGRFLRGFWQPVLRSQDLPRGRALPLRVLGQDFTAYRGHSGRAYLLDPRCAHRRTLLSLGWVEADRLRCFYHGWVYDGTGRCVEQPAESAGFAGKVRIGSYPTREYLGLVFAWLGEGAAPALPRHPEFEGQGVLEVETFTRPCNYFRHLELDPMHIAFVHRDSPETEAGLSAVPKVRCVETSYGYTMIASRPGPDGRAVDQVQHRLMPNVSLFKVYPKERGGVWRDRVAWRLPVDDDCYVSFVVDSSPGERAASQAGRYRLRRSLAASLRRDREIASLARAVLEGRMSRERAVREAPDVVQLQDTLVLLGQEGDEPGGSLAPDPAVRVLHRLWERELRALAAGAPLTQWRRPERLTAASGAAIGGDG